MNEESTRVSENVEKRDLVGLTPLELRETLRSHFAGRDQPSYRGDQVEEWIYERTALSFEEMTNLSKVEREALDATFTLTALEAETVARSEDGTAKHLWRLHDGEQVESVLIPTDDRLTLCVSSQGGCAIGCTFCATGWSGFRRQLSTGEIVAQYRGSRRWAEENGYGRITNIVYMGMGEPLANRSAVHPSLTILNRGYSVGARRITVSTVGLVPGILELARRPEQFRLAISLHSPDSKLRRELIPLEKRYPIPMLIEALEKFNSGGGRRITFEYTMIQGVNDSPDLAPRLADLATRLEAFVNLIPFNPIPYRDWAPSSTRRIGEFARELEKAGVEVAVRTPRGRDIDAACGQLRANAVVQIREADPEVSVAGDSPRSMNPVTDPPPADLSKERKGAE